MTGPRMAVRPPGWKTGNFGGSGFSTHLLQHLSDRLNLAVMQLYGFRKLHQLLGQFAGRCGWRSRPVRCSADSERLATTPTGAR